MVDPVAFERNKRFVIEELEQQLENMLKKGEDYINLELKGPGNALIRPIVRGFYNVFARPDINSGSKGNIRILISAASEIVLDDDHDKEEIIEKYFPDYLKNDQTTKFCKKNHRNYPKLVENTRGLFEAQLDPMVIALEYEGDNVRNYDELMVRIFKTVEEAKRVLSKQIRHMEIGIEILQSDPSVLNVPAGRKLIMRVLQRGIVDTSEELLGDVDEIFRIYG